MELPQGLAAALNSRAEAADRAGLTLAAQRLSERYRTRVGRGERLLTEDEEALAYALTRMPATFAAVSAALGWALECLDNPQAIGTLLDVGAGTGAAVWAAARHLKLRDIACLEREGAMRRLGEGLMREAGGEVVGEDSNNELPRGARGEDSDSAFPRGALREDSNIEFPRGARGEDADSELPREAREEDSDSAFPRGALREDSDRAVPRGALREDSDSELPRESRGETQNSGPAAQQQDCLSRAQWQAFDLSESAPLPRADLVTAAYVLGEMAEDHRLHAALRLLEAADQMLLIVEPGTPVGWARLMELRRALIAQGAQVAAPCPHGQDCPINGDDWCHFTARVARTKLHRQLKGADAPYEDEKFAYLALTKGQVAADGVVIPVAPDAFAAPAIPAAPDAFAAPAIPAAPGTPATPVIPAAPGALATPVIPAAPGVFVSPATPAAPGIPAIPAIPAAPGTPTTPAIPAPSITPADARILRHPHIAGGFVRLELCTAQGITQATVTRKQGAAYKRARKVGSGDRWGQ